MEAMTDLAARPVRPGSPRPTPRTGVDRSVTAVGVLTAVRCAGLGVLAVMVAVLLGWAVAADSGADATDAVVTGLQAWLLGHHAPLAVPGGRLALVPLGLTLLPLALLHIATLRAGRELELSGRDGVLRLTASVTSTYAVIATLVSLVARTQAVQAVPVGAFTGAAAVALLGAGSGAIRSTGSWAGLSRRVPPLVRSALPAATAAVLTLLAAGALLAGGSLAVHRDRAATLADSLGAGAGGGLLLGLIGLLYVPTAAVWAMSLLVGPGFAVGAGTSVSVAGTDLGAVPAFPLLAALPQEPGPGWAPLLLAVPLGAGALAALVARRSGAAPSATSQAQEDSDGSEGSEGLDASDRSEGSDEKPGPSASWRDLALLCGTVAGLVAMATSILAVAASGAAGPGRMAVTGPTWWTVAPLAGLEVGLVMAGVLAVLRRR